MKSKMKSKHLPDPPSSTLPRQSEGVNNSSMKADTELKKQSDSPKVKRSKVGNFKKELKQCDTCRRKFVNLQLHKQQNDCVELPDTAQSSNSNTNKSASLLTEKNLNESITSTGLEVLCLGCKKLSSACCSI